MKNFYKNLAIGLTIFFGGILYVYAAPSYTLHRSLLPETTNTYYLGSTSPNLQWKGIYTQDLTITGTCTGCGGGGGGSKFATSTTDANAIYTANANKLGIGTTSPYSALGVAGQIVADNIRATSSTAINYFAGNVGIASTSPSSNLGVTGSAVVTGSVTTNFGNTAARLGGLPFDPTYAGLWFTLSTPDASNYTFLSDGSNSFINSAPGASTYFRIANGDVMTISSASRVGIGTTDPQSLLGVSGSAAIGTYAGINAAPTNGLLVSGDVGIGTTSPYMKLGVDGSVAVTGAVSVNTGNRIARLGGLPGGLNYSGLWFTSATPNASNYTFLSDGSDSFINSPAGSNTFFRINNGDVMTVSSASRVGIGYTSPNDKLSVAGNLSLVNGGFIGFTSNTAVSLSNYAIYGDSTSLVLNAPTAGGEVYLRTNGTDRVAINSTRTHFSGNVGIGTASPYDKLDIAASGAGTLGGRMVITNSASNASGNYSELGFKSGTDFAATYYTGAIAVQQTDSVNTSNAMIFRLYGTDGTAAGAERMRLTSTGNLGIGTTTPFDRLGVSGSAAIANLLTVSNINATSTSATNFFAGKVGIGTSTPLAILSVDAPAGLDSFVVGSSTGSYFRIDKDGDVKTTVIRQDNTTNTVQKGNTITLTGWGVFAAGSAANKSETVTFGRTFAQRPIVMVTFGGDDTAGGTNYGDGGNEDKGPVSCKAHTITATNFVAHCHTSDGTSWAAGTTVFYQWMVIGEEL